MTDTYRICGFGCRNVNAQPIQDDIQGHFIRTNISFSTLQVNTTNRCLPDVIEEATAEQTKTTHQQS